MGGTGRCRIKPTALHKIRTVNTRSRHLDQNFSSRWLRNLGLGVHKNFGTAATGHFNYVHFCGILHCDIPWG